MKGKATLKGKPTEEPPSHNNGKSAGKGASDSDGKGVSTTVGKRSGFPAAKGKGKALSKMRVQESSDTLPDDAEADLASLKGAGKASAPTTSSPDHVLDPGLGKSKSKTLKGTKKASDSKGKAAGKGASIPTADGPGSKGGSQALSPNSKGGLKGSAAVSPACGKGSSAVSLESKGTPCLAKVPQQ